jgi:metal-responsive CopG/Arc/MetJ family transcriptional regulator
MKTIAITIDDETLDRIERMSGRGTEKARNRSQLIRDAVKDYVSRLERAANDQREAAVVRRHRTRLTRQATAAVRSQAKP